MLVFPLNAAFAEMIRCAPNVDLEQYPICEYEEQWNASERINQLIVDELANRQNDINDNPELFYDIVQESIEKVERENPGLAEASQATKAWISGQLGQ